MPEQTPKEHEWTESPGNEPCIGFMPECVNCGCQADSLAANLPCGFSPTTDNPLLTFAKGHAQAGLVDCAAASADDALKKFLAISFWYCGRSESFLAGHAARDAQVARAEHNWRVAEAEIAEKWSPEVARLCAEVAALRKAMESGQARWERGHKRVCDDLTAARSLADDLAGALEIMGEWFRYAYLEFRDDRKPVKVPEFVDPLLTRYHAQKEAR